MKLSAEGDTDPDDEDKMASGPKKIVLTCVASHAETSAENSYERKELFQFAGAGGRSIKDGESPRERLSRPRPRFASQRFNFKDGSA